MKTFETEKKQMEREIKDLEKKELKIGVGYKFKRTHGNKDCVKVIGYDNDSVEIQDAQGKHFIARPQFTTDNFVKGV